MKIKKKTIKLNDNKVNIEEVLLKKAIGYTTEEITEEFNKVDDNLVLNKRKVSTKSYPPDLSALQLFLEKFEETHDDFENFTLEDLEREKVRLLKELAKYEKEDKDGIEESII